ncbi:VgrG-related protein [Phormidium tenue]|jgi:phage protein D/phage baseplate assembly protein gpV|uniref:VgrG-related protein n=1 Tax=Phormidium tenue FACHB-1050 TaxID=2692857 RepID=A0ABR8C5Z5_9CYAN|nr:VgrG-related protein [Phormidium tenue]MBD2315530.1 VgrG-related protein [Phormidium tenue FACHB-1050]
MPKYIPAPLLKIDGVTASADLLNDILQISVEESLHQPGMFTLIINNDYFPGNSDTTWKHQATFAIGKKINIGFTSSTTEDTDFSQEATGYVLEGEITAIETELNEKSQAPIIVRGYDVSHRLHRGRYNRSFQNVKDSDMVSQIIGEAGIASGTITATTVVHEYAFQENQTNMEFLQERAARNGFELYVQNGKLNFREPTQDAALTLTWLEDIHSFRVRVTSAEQVSSVEVRGWDYQQKQAIVSTASTATILTSTDSGTGKASSTKFSGSPKMIVVDQPVFSSNEALKMAQSLYKELGGEFVNADAKGEGNPAIRPGKVITLSGIGNYSGSYYVTETHHSFQERKYVTHFSVRGLRGGNLFSILSSKTHLQPGQTMMVGVVSNNNDPKKWGRVRVKFPTLTEEHESNWARVVSVGAGAARGFDCLPEVNDEVLVAFEHGDIHRPYVIGGVWNGTDAPPEVVTDSVVNGKVRLRTFKTRLGHKLQFVEEDKAPTKKGVYLNTIGGHNLRLNDSDKFAELETTGGHKFRADDTSKVISLTSTGDITIKTGTSGTTKDLMINAANMTLTATTNITLKVGSSKIVISNTGVVIEGAQVQVKGTGSAKMEAPLINVEATGANTIKGAMVNVDASGIAVIKGSLVKIN